jgi:peptidyl-prolyl cis-trans isomerase A (cyclophilin A)
MKAAYLALLLCATVLAQTKSDDSKKAGAAKPNLLDPSTMTAQAPETFQVKFATTKGDFTVVVTRAWAPLGVDRFYNLVRAGFFTDAAFFRVVPGFMAQFGISARPDVAAVWKQARIPDDPSTQSNTRGRITFASAGPNTRTTQLFINYGDNSRLDPAFASFGEVTEGMEVVDKIYSEYREQPNQGLIQAQGKAYLDANFPMLDRITSVTILMVPATTTRPGAEKK